MFCSRADNQSQLSKEKGLSWRDGSVSKVCLPGKHWDLSLDSQNAQNACGCGKHLNRSTWWWGHVKTGGSLGLFGKPA